MQIAPQHAREEQRLRSLYDLELLDTDPEERFDRLTRLASTIIGTPIALITLIDRDRQWFKSKVGIDGEETSRDLAFCAHAVADDDGPLVVADARDDIRFHDNPFVTGDPNVRFYAGQPLHSRDGLPMGTLCVLDQRPRHLEPTQRAALAMVAELVEQEFTRMDQHELVTALAASEHSKSLILDTVSDGLILQDASGAIVQWNPAAEQLLGLTGEELIGRRSTDVRWAAVHEDGTPWTGETHPAMRALTTGQRVERVTMGVHRPDGTLVWLRVNSQPILGDDGSATETVTTFADVTAEIEHAARQRDLELMLLRSEMNARVSLDALDQGVILIDRSGTIQRINPAAERVLGFPVDELIDGYATGRWDSYDEHGVVLPLEQRPLVRAIATGERVVGQIITWRRGDGTRVLLRTSCTPDAGDGDALVLTFTDITAERLAQRLLDATLETAPVGLAILDSDRTIIRCNKTFADQAGREAEDLVGIDVVSLIHHDHRSEATEVGRQIRDGRRTTGELDQLVERPDGVEMWVNTHLAVISDPDRPLAIAATFDVTERRQLLLQLSRFSHLFHHANDIITIVDASGTAQYTSPSTQRILGYPDGWRRDHSLLDIVHPDDMAEAAEQLARLLANTFGGDSFTVRVKTFTSEVRHLECFGVNLIDEPAVGGVVITARDVTERVELTERLAHTALHDSLTNLPNRRLLEDAIERALARTRREGESIGLCFVDLDGFKAVNDTAGHAVGDELIVAVAEGITHTIRESDMAARVGGDEFVILLDPIAGPEQAVAVATRVRDRLITATATSEGMRCGASLGVAISHADDTVSSLLNRADSAMYRAKSRHDSSIELTLDHATVAPT